jgi:hypothetical protein
LCQEYVRRVQEVATGCQCDRPGAEAMLRLGGERQKGALEEVADLGGLAIMTKIRAKVMARIRVLINLGLKFVLSVYMRMVSRACHG